MRASILASLAMTMTLAGCGDDDVAPATDAGLDAGSVVTDGGGTDSGPRVDGAVADSGGPASDGGAMCMIPGGGSCASGAICEIGTCPDGVTPVSCMCLADGTLGRCTGACPPTDGGAPPVDAGPPADGGATRCALPSGGTCEVGAICTIAFCPDGTTPVSCMCLAGGMLGRCTGVCPP